MGADFIIDTFFNFLRFPHYIPKDLFDEFFGDWEKIFSENSDKEVLEDENDTEISDISFDNLNELFDDIVTSVTETYEILDGYVSEIVKMKEELNSILSDFSGKIGEVLEAQENRTWKMDNLGG